MPQLAASPTGTTPSRRICADKWLKSPAMRSSAGAMVHAVALLLAAAGMARTQIDAGTLPWLNTSLPVDVRVEALLRNMTLQEKLSQLDTTGGAIPRLGVRAFTWRRECQHGLVKRGGTTVYPSPLALAATFDDRLMRQVAGEIGDEARAYNNMQMRQGKPPDFSNCFSPHMHVARDPRWGRISETYGEDPWLASRMAWAFVTGLQGGDPSSTYLKTGATCKHFIGNDLEGNEATTTTRYNFDARLDPRDLRDTFLPPFEACIKGAQVASIMCSYNAVNGVPMCLSRPMLEGTLRQQLGFQGVVVTDCEALQWASTPRPQGQGYGSLRNVSALALMAGVDMSCDDFKGLNASDVPVEAVDQAARRVLRTRVRLGHLDPPSQQPFQSLRPSELGSAKHLASAIKAAEDSIVLLKNWGSLLPLNSSILRNVAIIGGFANKPFHLLGSYYGIPTRRIMTPLVAMRVALPGVNITSDSRTAVGYSEANIRADAARCQAADVCLLFLGTRTYPFAAHQHNQPQSAYDPVWEGEGHDRTTLRLSESQEKLWQAMASLTTKPLVVVLIHGGPLDVSDMHASPRVGAILSAWYPGQGAAAIADVLLGRTSPAGRLPVSWHHEWYTRLPITDMRMRASGTYPGRTYRYWLGEAPLYPFGHGLSYSLFTLSSQRVATTRLGALASVTLRNDGGMQADYVVLLFMSYLGPSRSVPGAEQEAPRYVATTIPASNCSTAANRTDLVQSLVGYQRVRRLAPGVSQRLLFRLMLAGGSSPSWAGFASSNDTTPPCGIYGLSFGADQPVTAALVLA